MKKKQVETAVYSAVGVAAMLLILIAVNFIAGFAKARIDLTAEKAYTLSDGTRKIVSELDTPVNLRLYVTQSDNTMPMALRTYARRIEDLLGEYRQVARGNIVIEKLDPKPDSEAEDSARLDGIQGQRVQGGEQVFLGLSVSMLDQKVSIPFFHPARERSLEYDISRAIAEVTRSERPVVGVMSPLQVFGQAMNPMMMQQGQRPPPPWVLISELQRDFDVRRIEMAAEEIDQDVEVLIVIHPRDITAEAQFAIDQFVLGGGRLIAFLDPLCVLDPRGGGNPMMGSPPSSSTMERLLEAWGIEFDPSKVVADLKYMDHQHQPASPMILGLTPDAIDRDDIAASQVDNLLMAFAGAFSGTPADGLEKTVLMRSSENSQLVEAFLARLSGEQILKEFKPSGQEHALAIRLDGRFQTAFPEGKPSGNDEDEDLDAGSGNFLRESVADGVVILVGDADMIHDQASVQEFAVPFGGQRIIAHRNGNLPLAQGMVDLLGGDSRLIAMRSRASLNRPFAVIQEMRVAAEDRYRSKIQQLEQDLADTQRRLTELQQVREDGQRFILSPQQQAELERFRQREAEVRRELQAERRKLRQDIDSLELWTKVINIAAMPLMVAFSGIVLALVKRKRTAAK